MIKKNNRQLGKEKEDFAADYLMNRGFRIMERNFRCRQGEIDLIGYDGEFLVFVEVKYRSSQNFADPLSAVNIAKMVQICKVADYYRYLKQIKPSVPIRYDVVGILKNETAWVKNAFPHTYKRY